MSDEIRPHASSVSGVTTTSDVQPRFSKPATFFWLLRLNRTVMVAIITGAGAFASGAGTDRSLLMTLAGWFLAVGGFSLDLYADRDLDTKGMRAGVRHNPLADHSLSPSVGLTFSVAFIVTGFVMTIFIAPWALIPAAIILIIVIGLALHRFETPLARAITLGMLQAVYLLMGGAAGRLSPGLGLLAGMFFFAMFGGRGMIDIRDFSHDEHTRVQTLPKRYGTKRTARFTGISLVISCILSLVAYFTGEFSTIYLYLDIIFIIITLVGAWLFVARPTPRMAYILTFVYMMGAGTVICLAIILAQFVWARS